MRKILTIFIAVLFLIQGFAAFNVSAAEVIFSDPDTEIFLDTLRGLEIFSLYEDERMFFNDSEPVTRAEAAVAICDLLGCEGMGDPERVSGVFLDVPEFHKAASSIDVMLSLGIMIGMNNGNFEPDSNIQLQAFAKAMVCALGWKWKAELNGGYPPGYLTTAYTMGLMKGIEGAPEKPLTRAQLVRIIYNSLDIPIYEIEGQSGTYKTLKTDKDVNVLNQYNDIYKEKAIVNSNAFSSLNSSYIPKSDKVLIGDYVLDVNGRTQISNYLGYEVEFYYREGVNDNKQLMYFKPTSLNQVHTVSAAQFGSYSNGKVYYNTDKTRTLAVNISSSAGILLNGNLLQRDTDRALSSGKGRMVLISNDGDSSADVVIIERGVYDKVNYVDSELNIIYGVNGAHDFSNAESIAIFDENGNALTMADILPGDVLEIVADEASEYIRMCVLRNSKRTYVKEIDKKLNTIIADDGEELRIADGANMTDVQAGTAYALCINRYGEAVWFTEQRKAGYQLGYLVKVRENKEVFTTEAVCTIVQESGDTVRYSTPEKLNINGKLVKAEDVRATLRNLKSGLNLASDGEVSQLIYFVAEGEIIKEIDTADLRDDERGIVLKCNAEGGNLFYRNTGYLTGIFDGKFAISSATKIFKIPSEQQEELDEDYFSTEAYTNNTYTDGNSYCVETYVNDNDEIVPFAAIWYTLSSGINISDTASLFMVESVKTVADNNGDPVTTLTGCYQKAKTSFNVKDDVEVVDVEKGDVLVLSLDSGSKIQSYKKVFDYSDQILLPEFQGKNVQDRRCIQYLKVYNAPEGSDFIEFVPIDFTGTTPEPEDITLVSFRAVKSGGSNGISTNTRNLVFEAKEPGYISGYKNNPDGCTKALVRSSLGYTNDILFFVD